MNAGKEFIKEAYRAIFQKDYQRAIDLFKKAISRDSNNPTFYYKLSVTYARNNNLKEAVAAIEQALALRPHDPVFQQHIDMLKGRQLAKEAWMQIQKGMEADCVFPLLEESIRLDPINSQTRLLYAWLLKEQGKTKDGMNVLNELLAIDPWHREAKDLLRAWDILEDRK